MENQTLKAIFERSSIRAYAKEPLAKDAVDTLKQVALSAPTAMNRQELRFFFITSQKMISQIERAAIASYKASGNKEVVDRIESRGNTLMYHAPLFVIVAINPHNCYAKIDAGIAVSHLAIAAKSMGLDSVILGLPSAAFNGETGDDMKQKLGLPEGYEYAIGISIGQAAMQKSPHESDESHIIDVE